LSTLQFWPTEKAGCVRIKNWVFHLKRAKWGDFVSNLGCKHLLLVAVLAAVLTAGHAFAALDPFGFEPSLAENPLDSPTATARGEDCRILYFKNPGNLSNLEFDRLVALGLDITQSFDPAEFTLEYLLQFDALIIYGMGADSLDEQAGAIETFVAVGGSLLIHQPNDIGTLTYAPAGFEVTVLSNYWCTYPDGPSEFVCPVDPDHPLVSGFTSDEMGRATDYIGDLGSGYSLIAVGCDCDDPALAAGQHGDGLVVFDTNNYGNAYNSDAYILNFMEYLCAGPGPVATRSVSLDGLKVLYR
jgi:hypothetical protein